MTVEGKPLGGKAYGSIPHVIGSRRGPADHGLEPGQSSIITEGRQGWSVAFQEKLDGSCMSVAKIDGAIVALGRAGFLASTSPYAHLQAFERWVARRRERFAKLLPDEGSRVVGEWMLLAPGMRYWIAAEDDLFVAFDIFERGRRRELPEDVALRCARAGLAYIESTSSPAELVPRFPAEGAPEGWVARAIDRTGRISFLGKWVRADFEQGKYLADEGQAGVYNYPPHLLGGIGEGKQ